MIKKNKGQLFIALTIVVIIFIVTSVVLLLYLSHANSVNNKGIITTFNTSQHVELREYLPVSDTLGKNFSVEGIENGVYGYLEFSVKNNSEMSSNYEIYITKDSVEKELNGNFIKFYLTDENDIPYGEFKKNKLPTYSDLLVPSDKPSSREIYAGVINANEELNFKLRVWLSDSYIISNDEYSFSFNVDVRAI